MFDPRPVTATVDRRRLIEVLDVVADAASALEALDGDPDLVRALRYSISEVASDLEAADLVGAVDTADDPVKALEVQLYELERGHVDERERHHAGLAAFGAAVPVTCHYCGAGLRARFSGKGWAHPRTDCPYTHKARPADRRTSAELVVRVAPDHRPSVRRSGGELLASLAQPDYELSGVRLIVAVPIAAARRWAIALCSQVGQSLAAAERGENEYGEPMAQEG
jgi:hypothetical protein